MIDQPWPSNHPQINDSKGVSDVVNNKDEKFVDFDPIVDPKF